MKIDTGLNVKHNKKSVLLSSRKATFVIRAGYYPGKHYNKYPNFRVMNEKRLKQEVAMKRLSELGTGTKARILSFEDNDLFLKLMEMGCVPGELVKIEQVAPLGDPISITVAGYNLSLRLNEADNIFVEEVDA